MSNVCIGIISYLPDKKEIRNERIKRLENLIHQCDDHFKLPIIIIAQNWKEFNLTNLKNSKLIVYKYTNKLGITLARLTLRSRFLESEFTHIIMLDDDMKLSSVQSDYDYYINSIETHNDIEYFYLDKFLNNFCCISNEGFTKISYDSQINAEDGTGFEDWIFHIKCKKFLKSYEIQSNLPAKKRSEFLNDPFSTWDPCNKELNLLNSTASNIIIKSIRNNQLK